MHQIINGQLLGLPHRSVLITVKHLLLAKVLDTETQMDIVN